MVRMKSLWYKVLRFYLLNDRFRASLYFYLSVMAAGLTFMRAIMFAGLLHRYIRLFESALPHCRPPSAEHLMYFGIHSD